MWLIDADAEVKKLEKLCEEKNCEYLKYRYQAMCKGCSIYEEIEAFDSAEKVEAEPLRHGRWVETEPDEDDRKIGIEFSIKCSRCHDENSHLDFNENHEITGKTFWKSRFCPNCGADMREEGADNG